MFHKKGKYLASNWQKTDCISQNGGGKSAELVQLADKNKEIIINADSSKMLLAYVSKVKNVVDGIKEFFCISPRLQLLSPHHHRHLRSSSNPRQHTVRSKNVVLAYIVKI